MRVVGKVPRGFTLIELLLALVILAILATIAVPGFESFSKRNRFSADYNEIRAGLLAAKSESIKRRDLVTFSLGQSMTNPWSYEVVSSDGSIILTGSARDRGVVITQAGGVEVSLFEVEFNSLGRRTGCEVYAMDGAELSQCNILIEVDAEHSGGVSVSRGGFVL